MNYIKHLSGFFNKVSKDDRLNPTHVSLYVSLFQFWNACRFHNPISISRNEVMRVSKISSKATYHKCIRELNDFGYLSYQPSYNPFKGSLVYLFEFQAGTEQLKNKNHIKTTTSPEQALVSYTNNSNNTKQQTITNEISTHEKNDNSENDSAKPSNEKKVETPTEITNNGLEKKVEKEGRNHELQLLEKKEKFREKKKVASGQVRPLLLDVQNYFAEKNYPHIEAEKFYNHYESNGWLVGGKTPMINWQASANNWILNTENFIKSSSHLERDERVRPGKLQTSNNKNYAEPL